MSLNENGGKPEALLDEAAELAAASSGGGGRPARTGRLQRLAFALQRAPRSMAPGPGKLVSAGRRQAGVRACLAATVVADRRQLVPARDPASSLEIIRARRGGDGSG